MPGSEGQAQGQRVEPKRGDLDNFFAWAQALPTAKASDDIKETLRQIENGYRNEFEAAFRGLGEGLTRKKLDASIKGFKQKFKAVAALEKNIKKAVGTEFAKFVKALPEIAQGGFVSEGEQNLVNELGGFIASCMDRLRHDSYKLEMLEDTSASASRETFLLRNLLVLIRKMNDDCDASNCGIHADDDSTRPEPAMNHSRQAKFEKAVADAEIIIDGKPTFSREGIKKAVRISRNRYFKDAIEVTELVIRHETGQAWGSEKRGLDMDFCRLKKKWGLDEL